MDNDHSVLCRLLPLAQMRFDIGGEMSRFPAVLSAFVEPFDRDITLRAATAVVDETMQRFSSKQREWESESDAWLGPRLHAALRLTRHEAADQTIWYYLAAYAFPDYVAWRWPSRSLDRFFSAQVKKHAFRRLWWSAELFRNGSDYELAEVSLSRTDFSNTILTLDAIHNRAIALAVARFWKGNKLTGRQAVAFSTQLNTTAVTVALDRVAPAQYLSASTIGKWLYAQPVPEDIVVSPDGPDDEQVSEKEIGDLLAVFASVIDLSAAEDVA